MIEGKKRWRKKKRKRETMVESRYTADGRASFGLRPHDPFAVD